MLNHRLRSKSTATTNNYKNPSPLVIFGPQTIESVSRIILPHTFILQVKKVVSRKKICVEPLSVLINYFILTQASRMFGILDHSEAYFRYYLRNLNNENVNLYSNKLLLSY